MVRFAAVLYRGTGMPCVFVTIADTGPRPIRLQRQGPVSKQVVELDEEENVVRTDGVIDVWKVSVLPIFRNQTVVLEGRQWSGTKPHYLNCRRRRSCGG